MLLFYFDLWWFETLVCYDNVVRFYCDCGRIMLKNIKTIHFSIISLTIIFFFFFNFVISIKWVNLKSISMENLNFIISIIRDCFYFIFIFNFRACLYMCLKTENCCLKTFLKIRVGEKVCKNTCNVI